MPDIIQALQTGTMSLWLFIPSAILLGALHGLEPGHSKTMMAAFIIAVRGTITQAVLLGLSAAISHSLIIWVLAALALHFGNAWNAETVEPYLQLGSAVFIIGLALWMFLRTRRELAEAKAHEHHHHGHSHGHDHPHEHGHHHHDECVLVPTGHGTAQLSIFEKDSPPVFRIAFMGEAEAEDFALETVREDGTREIYTFASKGDYFESTTEIPEPHEFTAILTFSHHGHDHTIPIEFREGESPVVEGESNEYQDAHERAHAIEIAQKFAGRTVTTSQIVMFGVTGGLMPCPAAFSVLLICLQLKKIALGFTLVAAFSVGLALTMVATGALAAWSVHHAERKFRGFGETMRRAPYVSCVVLVLIASYMAWHGWHALHP